MQTHTQSSFCGCFPYECWPKGGMLSATFTQCHITISPGCHNVMCCMPCCDRERLLWVRECNIIARLVQQKGIQVIYGFPSKCCFPAVFRHWWDYPPCLPGHVLKEFVDRVTCIVISSNNPYIDLSTGLAIGITIGLAFNLLGCCELGQRARF